MSSSKSERLLTALHIRGIIRSYNDESKGDVGRCIVDYLRRCDWSMMFDVGPNLQEDATNQNAPAHQAARARLDVHIRISIAIVLHIILKRQIRSPLKWRFGPSVRYARTFNPHREIDRMAAGRSIVLKHLINVCLDQPAAVARFARLCSTAFDCREPGQ